MLLICILIIVNCICYSQSSAQTDRQNTKLVIEEYLLGSSSVLSPYKSREFIKFYNDSTLQSKRSNWRSNSPRVPSRITNGTGPYLNLSSFEIDDREILLEVSDRNNVGMDVELLATIYENGNLICQFKVIGPAPTDIIWAFYPWKNDWILEYTNNVVLNCENLCEKYNYPKIFFYRIISNKVFYFFEKDESIWISFDGEIQSNKYDDVFRYACCEPGIFNPSYSKSMVWFYALKDNNWYYVEAGIYE